MPGENETHANQLVTNQVRCNDRELVQFFLSEPVMERRLGDWYSALDGPSRNCEIRTKV